MVNRVYFLDSSSTKKCDHDCDEALIKSSRGSASEYTYISQLMLWLGGGMFVNIKWVKYQV